MALQEYSLQTGAAVFVDRHGYQLPAVYSDFASEYEAVTNAVGVHDASYMGRLKATGEDGLDLLNRMSTNKVVDLAAGAGAVTVLTTARGRVTENGPDDARKAFPTALGTAGPLVFYPAPISVYFSFQLRNSVEIFDIA